MAWSDSLAPGFVGNDCVTAEIIYSIALARHEVVARSPAILCCMHTWVPPRKRCQGCVRWVGRERSEYSMPAAMAAMPAGRERASVPIIPWVFLQLPRFHPVYLRFSEQCEQQDNWHHEQDQQHSFQQKNNDFHKFGFLCVYSDWCCCASQFWELTFFIIIGKFFAIISSNSFLFQPLSFIL